jgi:hypothetical protein
MVVRIRDSQPGFWQWSGGFELQEKEDYFGLRTRHRDAAGALDGLSVILPVSFSVGASGVVSVSVKSSRSLPPYRIVNACAGVNVTVSQVRKVWVAACHRIAL